MFLMVENIDFDYKTLLSIFVSIVPFVVQNK
jgi:hypothetical protein